MHSVLEDCPHREKCFWGGDFHASWATGFSTLDSTAFYRECVNVYDTPPFDPRGFPGDMGVGRKRSHTRHCNDFSWPVSPLFITWRLYEMDGDLETARRNYEQMRVFLDYFEKNAPDLIPLDAKYGDHAAVRVPRAEQNKRLIAAMNFFATADRFSKLAQALGKSDAADRAADLAGRIRASILEKYYDAGRHTFGNGTQDSLALALGLPEPEERPAVAESLARVYRENGNKFDGGFMSYNIFPQLAENGEVDLALDMLRNTNYMWVAWSIAQYDATTFWELYYDQPVSHSSSLNHHAANHPAAWMLTHLAGIQATYRKISLTPCIPRDLEWVNASVETHHGTVQSSWTQANGQVTWNIVIPPNAEAELRFPDESKLPVKTVNAGTYRFDWNLN